MKKLDTDVREPYSHKTRIPYTLLCMDMDRVEDTAHRTINIHTVVPSRHSRKWFQTNIEG